MAPRSRLCSPEAQRQPAGRIGGASRPALPQAGVPLAAIDRSFRVPRGPGVPARPCPLSTLGDAPCPGHEGVSRPLRAGSRSEATLPLGWAAGRTDGRGREGLPSLGPAFSGNLRPPREPLTGALREPHAAQSRVAGDISHASPRGGRNPSTLPGGVPAGGKAAGPHLHGPRRTLPGASRVGGGPERTPHAVGPASLGVKGRASPCRGQRCPSGTGFSDSQQPGHTAGRKVQAETPSLPSGPAPGPAPEPGPRRAPRRAPGAPGPWLAGSGAPAHRQARPAWRDQ